MNCVITNLLAMLLVYPLILPTATEAQTTAASSPNFYALTQTQSQPTVDRIDPFELTYLAYQGNLKDQGIPSYGALIDAISFGKITAQKVMLAAVRANRLPAETLADRHYRAALQTQLDNLIVLD